jgi:hypothetical protein
MSTLLTQTAHIPLPSLSPDHNSKQRTQTMEAIYSTHHHPCTNHSPPLQTHGFTTTPKSAESSHRELKLNCAIKSPKLQPIIIKSNSSPNLQSHNHHSQYKSPIHPHQIHGSLCLNHAAITTSNSAVSHLCRLRRFLSSSTPSPPLSLSRAICNSTSTHQLAL